MCLYTFPHGAISTRHESGEVRDTDCDLGLLRGTQRTWGGCRKKGQVFWRMRKQQSFRGNSSHLPLHWVAHPTSHGFAVAANGDRPAFRAPKPGSSIQSPAVLAISLYQDQQPRAASPQETTVQRAHSLSNPAPSHFADGRKPRGSVICLGGSERLTSSTALPLNACLPNREGSKPPSKTPSAYSGSCKSSLQPPRFSA